MDQSTFLSRTLWSYRESEEYVDVILVCQDEPISAHIALLAPLLSSFGISFHCIEDLPDVLILVILRAHRSKEPSKASYAEHTILPFQTNLHNDKNAVKIEALEADDEGKGRSSGQHRIAEEANFKVHDEEEDLPRAE